MRHAHPKKVGKRESCRIMQQQGRVLMIPVRSSHAPNLCFAKHILRAGSANHVVHVWEAFCTLLYVCICEHRQVWSDQAWLACTGLMRAGCTSRSSWPLTCARGISALHAAQGFCSKTLHVGIGLHH